MPTVITKAALAERLGVSRPRVSQLVQQGLPVLQNGQVDLEAALAWVASHSDRSRNVGRTPKSGGTVVQQPVSPSLVQSGADPGHVLLIARARKALAETKRIERIEKLADGQVITAIEAAEYARDFSCIVRDAALSQADRLTDALLAAVADGDRAGVYRIIRDDNHRMLIQVSKAIANAGLANGQT